MACLIAVLNATNFLRLTIGSSTKLGHGLDICQVEVSASNDVSPLPKGDSHEKASALFGGELILGWE